MPDLLTFGQYRRSVMDFLARVKKDNIISQRAVATTGGSSYAFQQYAKDRFAFSLDWVTEKNTANYAITDLDVRTSYLEQLREMETALAPQEKQDHTLMGRIDLARKSAYATPLRMTLEQLRDACAKKLQDMLAHGTIQRIIANPGIMEYGFQNAAAILLQCPDATRLFTRRQLVEAQIAWPSDVRPLTIYIPTIRLFFERGGQWLPSAEATSAEQRGVAMGCVPTRQDIQFAVSYVYDISQLAISEQQRHVLTRPKSPPYSYESLQQFAGTLKLEKGATVITQEKAMPGLALRCFYDAQRGTIFVNPSSNPGQLIKSYLHSVSEAVVAHTSTQPSAVQQFEAAMLSLQLQVRGSIPPSAADFAAVSESFISASGYFDATRQFAGTMTALEASLARINRMAAFVDNHVSEIAASPELSQARPQSQTAKQSTQQSDGTEQISNFINQIE